MKDHGESVVERLRMPLLQRKIQQTRLRNRSILSVRRGEIGSVTISAARQMSIE